MSTITLLTSAGAVRVAGENLVIELVSQRAIEPPLTCPAIDAFIAKHNPEDDVVAELEHIREINSRLRYGLWHEAARADAAEAKAATAPIPETPAIPQPVTAAGADTLLPSVPAPHSAPSKAETGRAGGPVCAPVANQEHAGCRDDRHDLAADAGSRVRSGLGIGNAGWNSTVRNRGQSTPKPLRPHCMNPDLCASGTREHCHSCRKQMAESEAA